MCALCFRDHTTSLLQIACQGLLAVVQLFYFALCKDRNVLFSQLLVNVFDVNSPG